MLAHGFSVPQMVEIINAGLAKPSVWSPSRAKSKSPACGSRRRGGGVGGRPHLSTQHMSKQRHLPIDERLERAAQLVLRSRIFFDIWFYFEGENTRPAILDTMNCFSEFFRFDPHAHFVAFIVHIAALFEKRNATINLPDLTRELKQSHLISAQAASAVDALLNQADQLAPKVRILRSNLFAHRSAVLSYDEAFKKAAITPDQMRDLTEIALQIANHLLLARELRDHFFNELPREDAEAMLKALKKAQRL
jgi:hypothetical protein